MSWIGEQVTGTAATRMPGRPKVGVGVVIQGIVGNSYPNGTSQEQGIPSWD